MKMASPSAITVCMNTKYERQEFIIEPLEETPDMPSVNS
jgi:hypothetical protein